MITRKPNTVRIIGGRWRRRLLRFPNIPELRPTHDRIRETLFNWLMSFIEGATCLDLFAGSGVLGFEALSRGAKRVTFVDKNPEVIRYLKETAEMLEVPDHAIKIILGCYSKENLLASFCPYDIVFLDPPYHENQMLKVANWLETNACLAEAALIYIEMEKQSSPPEFPNWHCVKKASTARISYYLYQRKF